MEVKLYYDLDRYIKNDIKYKNFSIYIDEQYRLFFNRLTNEDNIRMQDFFVVDYDEFNTYVENKKGFDVSSRIELLIYYVFFEMLPENSLQIFLFFKMLEEEVDKIKKIKELINESIKKYSEKDQKDLIMEMYRKNYEGRVQNLLVLDKLLSKSEINKDIITNFIEFYIDLLEIYYKNSLDRVKLKTIMLKKRILEKNKLVVEYEKSDFEKNVCDITITKKFFEESCEKIQTKIHLLLIIFEEQIFFLMKRKNEETLQNLLEEKNGENTYFSFAKKYEPYFDKIFIRGKKKELLEVKNIDICFFKSNLFRVKIYFYLLLMKSLKNLIFKRNIDLSKIFISLNKNTCKVLKSNYVNLNRELSFKHFNEILNYLKNKEDKENKKDKEKIIRLFNLYSQYTKINMEEIYFFTNIIEYEMRFPFLEVKTREPNVVYPANFKFYDKEVLKVEYAKKNDCKYNIIYVLEKKRHSFDGYDIFIGKFLRKFSEIEYLFEDVITKRGIQIIIIGEEYEILGELLKIEFK